MIRHLFRPDNCDGTYEEFCDSEREHSDITNVLTELGKEDLLEKMKTFWPDWEGDNESFWSHEWNKHGTCVNTLEPDCYEDYKPTEEVGAYFEKSMELYEGLNTYKVCCWSPPSGQHRANQFLPSSWPMPVSPHLSRTPTS